jgi:hypothetical protein
MPLVLHKFPAALPGNLPAEDRVLRCQRPTKPARNKRVRKQGKRGHGNGPSALASRKEQLFPFVVLAGPHLQAGIAAPPSTIAALEIGTERPRSGPHGAGSKNQRPEMTRRPWMAEAQAEKDMKITFVVRRLRRRPHGVCGVLREAQCRKQHRVTVLGMPESLIMDVPRRLAQLRWSSGKWPDQPLVPACLAIHSCPIAIKLLMRIWKAP